MASNAASFDIREITFPGITRYIDVVADMRLRMFRSFPYLYQGNMIYETGYLQAFARDPKSLLLIAYDGDRPVGVATSLPLESGADILEGSAEVFAQAGFNIHKVYYYSEILVEPDYRKQGIAAEFYRRREAFARQHGFTTVCFSAVVREKDHPQRTPDYFDPAPYWEKQGFRRHDNLQIHFEWPTIESDGQVIDREHPMVFWVKHLA